MGILLVFSSCKTIKKTSYSNKNIKAISSKRIAKKHKNAHFEGKTIEVKYKVVYDDSLDLRKKIDISKLLIRQEI